MRRLICLLLASTAMLLTACGGGSSDSNQGDARPPIRRTSIVTDVGAIRFLEQATFGVTEQSISQVKKLGFEAYLDEQFRLSESRYDRPDGDRTFRKLQQRFFNNAINGNDQLRQRMAFALSHIFVVSADGLPIDAIYAYHNFLLKNAFANYYDLMKGASLHPTMGKFLDMANNAAGNPNENYARELMQLFSIGLFLLNEDGSLALDSSGRPIPTYSQDDVENLARALTGWTYATQPGKVRKSYNSPYYLASMQVSESLHDYTSKTILNGVYLSAGQTAEQDLTDSLTAIFMHQNVAPFVSMRLIQHFVTSNPSPAYIERVSRVFNNNGAGVKGDLISVLKAILLDDEARRVDYSLLVEPADGKLKEPLLFITSLIRSLKVKSNGYELSTRAERMGQRLFLPPSVFGDFPPDYKLSETELYGPEFKLQTSPGIVGRINFVRDLLYDGLPEGTTFDMSPWISLAADTEKLVNKIDTTLLRGLMSQEMSYLLTTWIDSIDAKDTKLRAQTGLYLAATSSQYSVQH